MRKAFLLLAATLIAVAVFGVNASTTPQSSSQPSTAQDFARQLLARPNVRLSAMGETSLRTIASGTHHIDPGDQGLNPDAGTPATGGLDSRKLPAVSPNVRVNDPTADTQQVDQTTQSETTIAVAGSNVAVGYNDSQQTLLFFTAGSNLSGYSYSIDGGAHFTDGGTLPNRPGFVNAGDPWMASDRAGSMYYSTLLFGVFAGEVGVSKSKDGGQTWTQPVVAQPKPSIHEFYFADKEAMTVGRDPSKPARDNVYVAWDDFDFKPHRFLTGLPVSHSYDGGKTWTLVYADRIDNDFFGCSFAQYFGAQPLVDPSDGTLYVAAEKISVDDPNCTGAPVVFSEVITKSTDGGNTFGPVVKIADLGQSTLDSLGLFLGPGQIMRLADFPTLALFDGDLYAAWNEPASGHIHIKIAKSTNGGANWTVADATSGFGDEVQPALSADSSGLHLLYYERNKNNTLDVYVSNSPDGIVFTPNLVTTEAFPGALTFPQFDPIIAFGYMGDYIANVSDGTYQYFAWGDNRDLVTDLLYPSGRADPDVFFARQ